MYRDLINSMDTAFDDGKKAGLIEGIEQGIEKGKTETILQMAKQLKQAGVAIDIIMQTTGLSSQEIEKL